MGFSPAIKTKVLVRCARICCLCFRQRGTKIELHHIEERANGGDNSEANALPLCFDCHAEVGSYNSNHPRGTKYKRDELIARRESLYKLVDSGALAVQMLVAQLSETSVKGTAADVSSAIDALPKQHTPSLDAEDVLARLLDDSKSLDALGSKLDILGENDSAWIVDTLISQSKESVRAIVVLSKIIPSLPIDQQRVAVERTLRTVVLKADVDQKTAILREFDTSLLQLPDDAVQLAFFKDVFDIVGRNQFEEVNKIVPILVDTTDAIPVNLRANYVQLMVCHAESLAYAGGPAAKRSLRNLSPEFAEAWLMELEVSELADMGSGQWKFASKVSQDHRGLISGSKRSIADDLATLSWRQFGEKYDVE